MADEPEEDTENGGGGCDCLNSDGYIEGEQKRAQGAQTAALLRSAAAAAEAVLNASQAVKNFKRQRDIARRALKIAEDQQAQLENVYWPRELQFMGEFSQPEVIEAIEVMGRRYAGRLASAVANKFAAELNSIQCSASRYCTSSRKSNIQALMLAKANAMSSARVLGRNIAFAEWLARNSVNFEKRMQAAALGRGYMSDAVSLLASASNNLSAAGANAIAGFNRALNTFGGNVSDYLGAKGRIAELQTGGVPIPAHLQYNLPGSTNNVGMKATISDMGTFQPVSLDTSQTQAFGGMMNSSSTQYSGINSGSHENQVNNGRPVNDDLARTGKVIFEVVDNTVEVDMDQFKLGAVARYQPGDTGAADGAGD